MSKIGFFYKVLKFKSVFQIHFLQLRKFTTEENEKSIKYEIDYL